MSDVVCPFQRQRNMRRSPFGNKEMNPGATAQRVFSSAKRAATGRWERKTGHSFSHHGFLLSMLVIVCCGTFPCGAGGLVAQNKYNFAQFGEETWNFVKQPVQWQASDWLKVGLVGAGTLLAMEADQPLREAALRNNRYSKSVPIECGRVWGELYTPAVLFGGFAVHSLITDDIRTRKIGFEIGQAAIYASAVNQLMKMAIGRARPYTNEGPKTFHPFSKFSFDFDYESLPSGHTTIAFALSTVLSRNVEPGWLKGILYVPAAFTFVSRVYQDQHWFSDAVLGAAIGYFVATWVVDEHENKESTIEMSLAYPLTVRMRF
jgi:hypothetical protein